jgi:hypothetical protein
MTSDEESPTTTRGGAVKRLLLLAGGAVGIGAVGGRALVQSGSDATATTATPTTREVVLHGRDFRLGAHGLGANGAGHGTRAAAENRTPKGTIVNAAGRELGTFKAVDLHGFGGTLQIQTFDLEDGSIVGVGPGGLHDKPFAIVGGTGRFTGASGTYVGIQSPREQGGDGTATFTLSLKA